MHDRLDSMKLLSIEDQIYEIFKGRGNFTFSDVREAFGHDSSDPTLYRALGKLESQKRIRNTHRSGRQKVFTAMGQSQLPHFKGKNGQHFPISELLKNIETFYDQAGRNKNMLALDNWQIDISMLFAIAQLEDKEAQGPYLETRAKLVEIRNALTRMAELVENVLAHPTMSGDVVYFKSIYGGDDPSLPTKEEIINFKRFVVKRQEK